MKPTTQVTVSFVGGFLLLLYVTSNLFNQGNTNVTINHAIKGNTPTTTFGQRSQYFSDFMHEVDNPFVRKKNTQSSRKPDHSVAATPQQNQAAKNTKLIEGKQLPNLPESIEPHEIPQEYAGDIQRFVNLLEQRKHEHQLDEQQDQYAQPVFFSTITPDINQSEHYIQEYFSVHSKRIFAIFENSVDYFRGKQKVLVKWHNSNQRVLGYDYVKINPNSKYNYAWMEMPAWEPGIYNVEIFELEHDIQLLASGSFFVQEMQEYVSFPVLSKSDQELFSRSQYSHLDDIVLQLNYSSVSGQYLTMKIYGGNNNNVITTKQLVLSATINGSLYEHVKYSWENMEPGRYYLELSNTQNTLVARTVFTIY